MTAMLMRSWWALILRGLAALLVALVLLLWPHNITLPLQSILAVYVLFDGLCCLAVAALGRRQPCCLALLCSGGAGLIAGVAGQASSSSDIQMSTAMYQQMLAGWAVIVGIAALACGSVLWHTTPGPLRIIERSTHLRLRRAGPGPRREWTLILAGVATLIFGALMLLPQTSQPVATIPLIALFLVVFGYLHLRLGLSLGWLAQAALHTEDS